MFTMSLSMFVRARRSRWLLPSRLDMHVSTAARDTGINRDWVRTEGVRVVLVEVFCLHGILLGYLDGLGSISGHRPMSRLITFGAMAIEGRLERVMIGMSCIIVMVVMVVRMVSRPRDMHVSAPGRFRIVVTSAWEFNRLRCLSMRLGRMLVRLWQIFGFRLGLTL
jgi:hypothetical protein